jgi:chromosome segregation ATPase
MTTAIETTKREMYGQLARIKFYGAGYNERFELALEAHLEELRKELKTAKEDAQGANTLTDEFQQRLMVMTEERDGAQSRMQAIDHAYHVQAQANIAAGEELREAKRQLKKAHELTIQSEKLSGFRLTELQKAFKELSTLRKSQGSTSAQDSTESVSGATRYTLPGYQQAVCNHLFAVCAHNGKIVCAKCRVTAGEQA